MKKLLDRHTLLLFRKQHPIQEKIALITQKRKRDDRRVEGMLIKSKNLVTICSVYLGQLSRTMNEIRCDADGNASFGLAGRGL